MITERNDAYERVVRPEELGVVRVLQGAALESVWGVLEHCPVAALKTGQTLAEGTRGPRTMYLIVDGAVRVETDQAGKGPVPTTYEAGDVLGDVAMLEGKAVGGRIVAIADSRLIVVDEQSFWRLVGVSHAFAASMLATVGQRLRLRAGGAAPGAEPRPALEAGASVDGLTGLPGKEWLGRMLPRIAGRYQRDRRPLSILLIDIDHLARVNESFGHQAGDLVLTSVGRILRWCLRPTDISARIGGEEFCVVLPGASKDGARAAAERLRQTVLESQIALEEGAILPPTALSIGIAELRPESDARTLLQSAAGALARAKKAGGNRTEW